MGDSLQRLGLNQLNHKLKVKKGGIEVTSGNISGSSTSTGSFGKLEVAGNTTLTGDITIGGNMTLGDADTDSINISADLTSNLIPNADSTYDIGTTSKNWKYGYIEEFSATNITSSNNISASGTVTAAAIEIVDSLNVSGHITASGDVSASGNIYGTGNLDIDGTSNLASDLYVGGNITGSNDISASGKITSTRFQLDGTSHYIDKAYDDSLFLVSPADVSVAVATGGRLTVDGNFQAQGHITASGNISSSGTITIPQIINFEGSTQGLGGVRYSLNNLSQTQNGATGRNLGFHIATGSHSTNAVVNISGSGGNAFVGIGTAYTDAMYHALTVKGNISASGDVDIDGNITSSGTITGSALYGTTIGQNRTDGVKTITIEANSIINQDLSTDADATLGTLGVGNVTSTGIVKAAGVLSGSSDAFFGQYGVSYVSASNGSLQATNYISGSEVKAPTGTFGTATISAGTITGITDLTVADGGTGASSLTDGGILLGSGTDAITAMSVLSDGEMIVGDGSTDPVAESGATLRTSIGVGTGDNVTFTNITGAQISGSGDAFFGQYGVNYVSASVGNIQATGYVSGSDIKGVSGDLGSLSVGNVTSTGTITGSAVYGTSLGQNRTDGVKTITIEANSVINQDLTTDANPTFAGVNLNGDSNITGSLTVTGDLTAQQYIVSSSVTYMTQSFASGSNIFGDDVQDTHQFTGSVNVSGSITATSPETGSTTIIATNMQNGYPTSNFWGENLDGSYFNNFDNTTHVSEILRFMSGVLSASLDVADASPNEKTWASVTTNETNKGGTDSCDGYLPQSYNDSNATLKYLVTKNWVGTGTTIFSGISVYHDNGPTYKIDFDSAVNNANLVTVSSSADSQLFGLGGLSSGTATQFDVRVVATQSFSDTGSVSAPTTASATYFTQSQFDVSMTSFGTSNGVELAKINTTQPAVIPAAYQDGKFADLGGLTMSGSLTRRYSGSSASQDHSLFNDFSSVSASGYYRFHDLAVGIATGSGNFRYLDGTTKTHFWAPIDQIETDIGSNTRGITNVTQSYLSATSRSLSGAPYLIGATYHLSASVHGLFDPMYAASSTIADDTIGSVGVGSVAGSGIDDMSTSGGTIQTANAVFSDSGSSPTVRSTSTVPYRTDIYKHNATYTLSGTTGENVSQTGVSDSTFTVGVRGRNRASSRSTLATYTYFYHSGSTFGQPADSGSMAVFQRSQGYDGGSLAGTTETFTGEDFRIQLADNVQEFDGTAWTTTYELNQLGSYDLQVKPGYLVDPGGTYRYWYYEDYNDHATYKYYIRRFQTDGGTKTSMTVNLNNTTLVNWNSTSNGIACAILFESSGKGSGNNSSLGTARIYDPSATTSNLIEADISNDNHKNPFTTAISLYGNTGGSVGSNTYTVPIRNADGMYLDGNDNELYIIVRYKGDPTPLDDITLTFS